jgi:hypothetical protein
MSTQASTGQPAAPGNSPAPGELKSGQEVVVKAKKDEEVLETWYVDVRFRSELGETHGPTIRVDVYASRRRVEEVELRNISKVGHAARLSRVELLALLEVLKHYELLKAEVEP